MINDSAYSCNIVDRERVISKGTEIAFLKELQKVGVIRRSDIDI